MKVKMAFRDDLLASSFLVLSLNLSFSGHATDLAHEIETPRETSMPQASAHLKNENAFFIKTEFGNWKFSKDQWVAAVKATSHADEKEAFFQIAKNAADKGHEEALPLFYEILTKECYGLNKTNNDQAFTALKKGLLLGQQWVVPIYINALTVILKDEEKSLKEMKKGRGQLQNLTPKQEEYLSLLRDVVNVPLPDPTFSESARKLLAWFYPFHAQNWITGFAQQSHKETFDQLLIRLKGYGNSIYFINLYEHIQAIRHVAPVMKRFPPNVEEQLLWASSQLGDTYGYQKYYSTIRQPKKEFDHDVILAQERGIGLHMYNLGVAYKNGKLVPQDLQKSYEWLTKAADCGFNCAILALIQDHWFVEGPRKDLKKSIHCLTQLTAKGDTDAFLPQAQILWLWGHAHFEGKGVEQDVQKALDYFRKGADLGDNRSIIDIANAYQDGKGVQKNLQNAIQYWEKSSISNPRIRNKIGACYQAYAVELQKSGNSKQAQQYHAKAYGCYQTAASEKDPDAMLNLCMYFHNGINVKKDPKQAKIWGECAAAQGHPGAMSFLGNLNLYYKPINPKLAEEWFKKAYDAGETDSLIDLGFIYATHYKQPEKALDFYKKAAELGYASGQYGYALLVFSQYKDNQELEGRGLYYLHQAAESGLPEAMVLLFKYHLERGYTENEKGQQNLESAWFWLQKAAALNNFEAKELLKAIENYTGNEQDDAVVSPELQKCLDNIEDLDNGKMLDRTPSKLAQAAPFITPEKEASETQSSDEEKPVVLESMLNPSNSAIDPIESGEPMDAVQPIIKPQPVFKNPKILRPQLNEASLAFQRKLKLITETKKPELESRSIELIRQLRDLNDRQKLTKQNFKTLFSDPYFQSRGRVIVKDTKSGIAIIAQNFSTMDFKTAGTHRNHNKTYKGYHRNFFKEAEDIVDMFKDQ